MSRAQIQVLRDGRELSTSDLGERFAIGRSSKSHLVVSHHGVSRRHAEIRDVGKNTYYLFDAGSRNGTYVNGQRVNGSRRLLHGDRVLIGDVTLHFLHEVTDGEIDSTARSVSEAEATDIGVNHGTVVVMVSDIRNYTRMTERFGSELQVLVADWFAEVIELVKLRGGTVDKIHGDGILVYWEVERSWDPSPEVAAALHTAQAMLARRHKFQKRWSALGAGGGLDIGVALSLGEVSFLNLGTGADQSFTITGDCVNVAFRLEGLTKEKHRPLLVAGELAVWAPPGHKLAPLGEVRLEGRAQPLEIAGTDPTSGEPEPEDAEEPTVRVKIPTR